MNFLEEDIFINFYYNVSRYLLVRVYKLGKIWIILCFKIL